MTAETARAIEESSAAKKLEFEQAVEDNVAKKDTRIMLRQQILDIDYKIKSEEDHRRSLVEDKKVSERLLEEARERLRDAKEQGRTSAMKLQQAINLEIEAIADLSASVKIASEDQEVLNQCLKTKNNKFFEIQEKHVSIQRLIALTKDQCSLRMKDLNQQKVKEKLILEEKLTATLKLNEKLDSLDAEIARLRDNIKLLEDDHEADEKLATENKIIKEITSTVGDIQSSSIDHSQKSNRNYKLDAKVVIDKTLRSSDVMPKQLAASIDRRTYDESPIRIEEQEFGAETRDFMTQEPGRGSEEELNCTAEQYSSPRREKAGVVDNNSTRDLIGNASYASNALERSAEYLRPFDPTSSILFEMREDLRVVRQKRDDMLHELKNKIRHIEDAFDNSIVDN